MKRSITWLVAALAVGTWPSLSVADYVYGTVITHNGIGGCEGLPQGTGEVDVIFRYPYLGGPHNAIYREVATHEVTFTYSPGPATNMWNRSYIYNRSDVAWSRFVIRLEGADFAGRGYGNDEQARAEDPVVDGYGPWDSDEIGLFSFLGNPFTLLDSEIVRFNPEGSGFADAELTVWFDNPVRPQPVELRTGQWLLPQKR